MKTLETRGQIQERYSWKKLFLLELYRRGLTRESILAIYKFVDWVMEVPEELDMEINQEIKTIEEEMNMPHITTAERIGLEKGREIGLHEGLQEGLREGLQEGLQEAVAIALEIKFGEAGIPLIARARQVNSVEKLKLLLHKIKHARSLPDAQKAFDEMGM